MQEDMNSAQDRAPAKHTLRMRPRARQVYKKFQSRKF